MPAAHARFVCPLSQADKPIMALRRSARLDTSMARLGPDTDRSGRGPNVAPIRAARHSPQAMALPRPTGTIIEPSMPEMDQLAPTKSLSDAPRIALPKNLAQTLQFLSDDDLEMLRVSVETEVARRRPSSAGPLVPAPQPASATKVSRGRPGELNAGAAIPAGRASLIKASYHAGMKPVAIARTLRVSLSVVNKVLGTASKARRR